MAKTQAEQREYQRGYNRATARGRDRAEAICRIARGYRSRLTDHDTARICEACDRWTRGGDLCHWGYCRADFEWGAEPRMWADSEPRASAVAIITQPEFGCVSWIPKAG